jgi:hypothetical protein
MRIVRDVVLRTLLMQAMGLPSVLITPVLFCLNDWSRVAPINILHAIPTVRQLREIVATEGAKVRAGRRSLLQSLHGSTPITTPNSSSLVGTSKISLNPSVPGVLSQKVPSRSKITHAVHPPAKRQKLSNADRDPPCLHPPFKFVRSLGGQAPEKSDQAAKYSATSKSLTVRQGGQVRKDDPSAVARSYEKRNGCLGVVPDLVQTIVQIPAAVMGPSTLPTKMTLLLATDLSAEVVFNVATSDGCANISHLSQVLVAAKNSVSSLRESLLKDAPVYSTHTETNSTQATQLWPTLFWGPKCSLLGFHDLKDGVFINAALLPRSQTTAPLNTQRNPDGEHLGKMFRSVFAHELSHACGHRDHDEQFHACMTRFVDCLALFEGLRTGRCKGSCGIDQN